MENRIIKEAKASGLKLDDKQLELINKLSIKPLTADEVYVFKVAMCDNEIDRDFEVFPTASLKTLAKLFKGKTVITNHAPAAQNQIARIYDTEVIETDKTASTGEKYAQLIAYCYMLRTDSNKDLIAEIDAGIKKEVSVGCSISSVICSICGKDRRKEYCEHWWGKEYDGKVAYFRLEKPTDAYELSFVAIPAQQNAGVIKSYGVDKPQEKQIDEIEIAKAKLALEILI